jgi:hypothetical protein
MGTVTALLACYCPRITLSSPGKPSDPGISSESLPAQPGIQQDASRRSHVTVEIAIQAEAVASDGTPVALDLNQTAARRHAERAAEAAARAAGYTLLNR